MRTTLGDRWADIQETAPKKFPIQQSLSRGRSSRRQLKRAKMASWRLDRRKACVPSSGDELLSALHMERVADRGGCVTDRGCWLEEPHMAITGKYVAFQSPRALSNLGGKA